MGHLVRSFSIDEGLWDQFQRQYVLPRQAQGEYKIVSKLIQDTIKTLIKDDDK